MTEKKKLPERRAAHDYWAVTEKAPYTFDTVSGDSDPRATRRTQLHQDQLEQRWHREGGRRQRESVGAPVSLRRVVTAPPPDTYYTGNAFVDRQRRRRERALSHGTHTGQTQYVARTLAQTGTHASSGRIPVVLRSLPSRRSPVPTRSGRQRLKRNRFWRFLSISIIVLIIIVLINFLLTSNAFRIAQVRVVGTHNDTLIKRVQNMGMQGQNIFLLDVADLATRIDAQPEVAMADISKQWPNQLVVSIKERVPVLLWQTPKATFSVDGQGMVIAPTGNTVAANHLSTVIDTSSQPAQGSDTEKSQAALRPGVWVNKSDVTFAVAIMKQLPSVIGGSASSYKLYYNGTMYSSANQTSEEGVDGSGSYTIENVVANWKAYLGSAGDPNPLSNRLLELRSILDLARQEQVNVATIDLRYGLHPVFTVQ